MRQFLDHVNSTTNGSIDVNRLYAGGHSLGATGVWLALQAFAKDFAAAIVLSGNITRNGQPPMANISAVARVPIWNFYGAYDVVFAPAEGQEAHTELVNAGAQNAMLTIYPDLNHDIGNFSCASSATNQPDRNILKSLCRYEDQNGASLKWLTSWHLVNGYVCR